VPAQSQRLSARGEALRDRQRLLMKDRFLQLEALLLRSPSTSAYG
jgi:hypothetical protein